MAGRAPTTPSVQRPQDAATLVIIDDARDERRILMGRRRPEQIFLPNKFVFPGGGLDKADRTIVAADELRAGELARLMIDMKGHASPGRARGLALAAIRETFEEAGVMVGRTEAATFDTPHASWRAFLDHGIVPALADLTFFARAITPPGRSRRYDTRFFFVSAKLIAKQVAPRDNELLDLDWFTFDEVRTLDVPNITRAVLEDLADRLEGSPATSPGFGGLSRPDTPLRSEACDAQGSADPADPGFVDAPVPFYFFKGGSFERILLNSDVSSP